MRLLPSMDCGGDLGKQIAGLARIMKVVFYATLIVAFGFDICVSSSIPGFEKLFHDMLGGKPLPAATQIAINFFVPGLAIAILLLLAGTAALFMKSAPRCLAVLGVLTVLAAAQSGFVGWAISLPFLPHQCPMSSTTP